MEPRSFTQRQDCGLRAVHPLSSTGNELHRMLRFSSRNFKRFKNSGFLKGKIPNTPSGQAAPTGDPRPTKPTVCVINQRWKHLQLEYHLLGETTHEGNSNIGEW